MKLTIPINSSRLAKLAMLTSTMILTSPYGAATDRLIAHGGNSSLDNGQSIIHTSKNDSLNRLAGDAPNSSNSLSANQQLNTNEYLASSNDNYRLYMQSDGNLVLRETATSSALWASGTSGTGAVRIHFQGDGNLVMRDGNSSSVWSSASHNQGGDRLVLNNNGSLVIYAGDNVIWYQGNLPPVNSSPTDVATGNDFELNESLYADDVIFSSNNDYKLTMQGDGNLVLRNNVTSSAIWASGTSGTAASYVRFQGDGNFIIFDDNGNSVWKSNTEFDNADSIILHDNGALVMYSSATVVWSVGNTPPVIDTTPPMISLNGANTIALEVGDNYSDAGATATDDTDGDVSSFITTTGSVNTNITGTYTLSYDVSDSAGNAATTVYRNIIVSNPPTGDTPTSTNSLGPDTNLYTDEYLESTNGDYRLYMQGDGNLVLRNTATNSPLWSSDTVGTGAIRIRFQGDGNLVMRNAGGAAVWSTGTSGSGGDYIVVNGNGSLVIYDGVNVVWSVGNPPPTGDSTAPIISLNGSSTVDINQYDSYTDAGATATDNQDGDLSANIQVTGSVNTNVVGTYTVSYNVTDSTGNQADTVNRTVNVIWGGGTDTIAPMISLVGNSIVNIIEGSSYNDAGATASDNADGDISNQVVTQGSVDIFTPASYTLTYSVSDAAGNIATPVTRTVNVLSNSGNSGGAVTQGNGRFSAPSAALYGLNDSNARVADRYIDTNWGGNGHAQSWDGRLFVRATSSGWLADAFRPERVSKNTDGTPNFGGAFSGRVLLEAKVSTKTSGTNTHHNWLAIIPDPEHTGKNPYRSNASGSASSSGSYETYKTVVYHTAEEYNGNGDRTRKDSIGFRKATFIINNAKTSNATVTHASFTSNFQYMRMTNSNTIYCIEPSVTNDGRLIICQGSRDQNGNIDHLIYSYNQNPAVINGWSVAKNLSQMHYDDRNTNIAGLPFYQRYPIAEFAIKEASGRILSNGETIRGAYPWISRDGSELFYQHSRRRDGSSNANPGARRTGTAVVGRWTGGIIRHIDGSINRSRYNHSRLFLSSTGAFTTMWSAFKDLQDPILPYSLRGASYGLFHSNGEGYHEVGFEDFLDGNYIMYLGMNEQLPVDNGNQEHMINNTPDTSGHFNNGILVGAKFPYEYDGGDTLEHQSVY